VKTTTDENGNYDFFDVKVGRYTIAVEAAGFSRMSTPDVVVNVGARQRVDLAMQVGAITETVQVNGGKVGAGHRLERTRAGDQYEASIGTAAQRAQLRRPGAIDHQRAPFSTGDREHAARGRIQRERDAEHV
jgi:hypothetical protein